MPDEQPPALVRYALLAVLLVALLVAVMRGTARPDPEVGIDVDIRESPDTVCATAFAGTTDELSRCWYFTDSVEVER